MFGIKFPLTKVEPATLSSFCKMSSDTSFSELISGTTSSCSATFLNSILDDTAATLFVIVAFVVFVRVFTGTGISVPDALIGDEFGVADRDRFRHGIHWLGRKFFGNV